MALILLRNGTEFRCATVDCPEWSNSPKLGCYRKYSLDACCSVREICSKQYN